MIGHVDDTAQFKSIDITPSFDYDCYILHGKMSWSKNVHEERDAPAQIIFAANDPKFCIHMALAIFLEHSLMNGTTPEEMTDQDLLFNVSKFTTAQQFKSFVSAAGFPLANDEPICTHSIRKFAASWAINNGCNRDEVDNRGRWKRQRRTVDTYIDVYLSFPDAKVRTLSLFLF
jgi:hypothetical protein